MRDILFAVIMLSLPASVAVILGGTFLSMTGEGNRTAAGPPEARRAAALYDANCAACHGREGEGSAVAPALTGHEMSRDRLSDEAMRSAIRRGIAEPAPGHVPMPGFPHLEPAETDLLIRYLRARQAAPGAA